MQGFIKKRILIIYIALIIVSLIFFDARWIIVAGITLGLIFGLIKYIAVARFVAKILSHAKEHFKLIVVFMRFSRLQLVTMLLMAVLAKINLWLLAGFVAGILAVPIIIMINSITEALGISHNYFQ